jgi:hypothetical protein
MAFPILFYGTFFLILIVVGYIAMITQNKLFKTYFEKFLVQTKHLECNVIRDIRMRQISRHVTGMGKEYLYLGDTADIYLFDNFMVLFRKQIFVVDLNFKPIIITCDTNNIGKQYSFGDICEPKKFLFRTTVKGEIIITLTNKNYKNSDTIITLKKLSSEQIKHLTKVKEWSSVLY